MKVRFLWMVLGGGIKFPRIFYPPPPPQLGLVWLPYFNLRGGGGGGIKFPTMFYPPIMGVGVAPLLQFGGGIKFPRIFYPPPPIGVGVVPLFQIGGGG